MHSLKQFAGYLAAPIPLIPLNEKKKYIPVEWKNNLPQEDLPYF